MSFFLIASITSLQCSHYRAGTEQVEQFPRKTLAFFPMGFGPAGPEGFTPALGTCWLGSASSQAPCLSHQPHPFPELFPPAFPAGITSWHSHCGLHSCVPLQLHSFPPSFLIAGQVITATPYQLPLLRCSTGSGVTLYVVAPREVSVGMSHARRKAVRVCRHDGCSCKLCGRFAAARALRSALGFYAAALVSRKPLFLFFS